MSDLRTSLQNNFQTVTTGAITDGDLTVPVDTIGDLTSPAYVTLVSADGSDREVLLADGTWGASSLVCSDVSSRGLDGSTDGAQAWAAGTTVEVRPLAQHFGDLHDRVDADRTDFDAHDHDGTDSPTVATSNLTGHDKATHDALGIDAATLDGNLPAAFAAVAGDTFTGGVTFEDGAQVALADNAFAESDPATSYPNGITTFRVSGGSWPATSTLITFNSSVADGNVTQILSTLNTPPVQMFRRWISGSSAWSDWTTMVTAESPGVWEVDNSTEVAPNNTITASSWETVASVTVDVPSDWGGWKCHSLATFLLIVESGVNVEARLVIDGTAQPTVGNIFASGIAGSIAARRTGMSTTGTRTISLQMQEIGSGIAQVADIHLYARAVRTS